MHRVKQLKYKVSPRPDRKSPKSKNSKAKSIACFVPLFIAFLISRLEIQQYEKNWDYAEEAVNSKAVKAAEAALKAIPTSADSVNKAEAKKEEKEIKTAMARAERVIVATAEQKKILASSVKQKQIEEKKIKHYEIGF